jgi:hypothetical protein
MSERWETWVERAECRGYDPELFFPSTADSEWLPRRICRRCPVARECLRDALAAPMNPEGIWGGTSKRERKRLLDTGSTKRRPVGSSALNAAKTHCLRGHEYTEENTSWSNGTRSCKTCRALLAEQRRARKAAA